MSIIRSWKAFGVRWVGLPSTQSSRVSESSRHRPKSTFIRGLPEKTWSFPGFLQRLPDGSGSHSLSRKRPKEEIDMKSVTLTLAAVLLLTACSGDRSPTQSTTTTPTAALQIVEVLAYTQQS